MESTSPTRVLRLSDLYVTAVVMIAAALLTGCHLDIDVDDHPYPDDAGSSTDVDVGPPTQPDASDPTDGPRLLITELMIAPTPPDSSSERTGQYIELHNAGDEPIDPTDLVVEVLETNDRIRVDTLVDGDQEAEVVDNLRPIEPGDFFVFVREDDPDFYQITSDLEEGTYYEYGRWHRPISLSTSSQSLRVLQLHSQSEFEVHHEIGWREGSLVDLREKSSSRKEIRQDIGLGLEPDIEKSPETSDPANWCYHLHRFSDGPLLGSPGRPSPASCI